jgi:hypothetical protein
MYPKSRRTAGVPCEQYAASPCETFEDRCLGARSVTIACSPAKYPASASLGTWIPPPPQERYAELFRAAQTICRAGIVDENRIIPTLVFAARSFELQNLSVMREQLAEAREGGEKWGELKGTIRRAFDTLELEGVHDGVPIIYSRPFKLRARIYPETGTVEKVVIEVYRRSAKGKEIAEWYDALLSKHDVSYESRQGGFGWRASSGCLQMVFHRLAPSSLNPMLEGRVEVNAQRNKLPLPHPDIVADLCEALIGSVGTRGKGGGFAPLLGGRDRGRSFDPGYLIPGVMVWYVGDRGNVLKQDSLKPKVARILRDNLGEDLLRVRDKHIFHDEGWDSGEYIWEFIERISQPVLRVDHELREGYFGPLGYIVQE